MLTVFLCLRKDFFTIYSLTIKYILSLFFMRFKFLLCIFCIIIVSLVQSQTCIPDPQYTIQGIYPDTLLPACLWSPYQKTLTAVIPKDTVINNQSVIIQNFEVLDILSLPDGMTYECGTPGCMIDGGTSGCISIFGTPDTFQTTGTYPLRLIAKWRFTYGTQVDSMTDTLALPMLHLTPKIVGQIMGITEPNCDSVNQGSAIVYGYGANPPFYYLWDNGQVGTVGTQLNPGIHHVYITDNVGCQIMRQITIETAGSGPVANMIDNNPTCFGEENGSVQINMVNTSTPPFYYSWSTGDTSSALTGLPAGSYIVAITDGLGCVSIYIETLVEPLPFLVNVAIYPQTPGLNDAYIIAEPTGGSPPYEYSWNTGETSETLLNITAGTYTLYLTDEQGCTFDTTFVVPILVSLAEPEKKAFAKVYPNPLIYNQKVVLEMEKSMSSPLYAVLYNLQMQPLQVWEFVNPEKKNELEFPRTQGSGVYFLELKSEGKKEFHKIIFAHP